MGKDLSFEEITIVVEWNMKEPDFCKGTSRYYTIYPDGLVVYCSCAECGVIDPEDYEKVIKLLENILLTLKTKARYVKNALASSRT